jgi:hypothetical protein
VENTDINVSAEVAKMLAEQLLLRHETSKLAASTPSKLANSLVKRTNTYVEFADCEDDAEIDDIVNIDRTPELELPQSIVSKVSFSVASLFLLLTFFFEK